jgi:hypothetical protein
VFAKYSIIPAEYHKARAGIHAGGTIPEIILSLRTKMVPDCYFILSGYNHLNYTTMPRYVIEREIQGAGRLTPDELKDVSKTSCDVLRNMGPEIQWVQSYVTGDKIYCVYIAPDEEMIREHARQGGFPANAISQVSMVIDPTTAE